MIHPNITSLYKYRGFNTNSIKCLIDEVAWFSVPASFNDPFDCGIYLDKRKMEESVKEVIKDIKNRSNGKPMPNNCNDITENDIEAFNKFREDLHSYVQSLGIFSLSSINNDILMWGHYADSHAGFCIEYERSPENILGKQALPVIYQKSFPSFTGNDVTSSGEKSDHLWRTKSEHWSYEKEWRIVEPKGEKAYLFPCRIRSIIFGLKMEKEEQYTLRKLLEFKGVSFKKAVIDDNQFSISIVST